MRFDILQPLSPPLRAEANTWEQINWFLQPERPSPVAPAQPLLTVLPSLRVSKTLLAAHSVFSWMRPLPLALPLRQADTLSSLLESRGWAQGVQRGREGQRSWQELEQTLLILAKPLSTLPGALVQQPERPVETPKSYCVIPIFDALQSSFKPSTPLQEPATPARHTSPPLDTSCPPISISTW